MQEYFNVVKEHVVGFGKVLPAALIFSWTFAASGIIYLSSTLIKDKEKKYTFMKTGLDNFTNINKKVFNSDTNNSLDVDETLDISTLKEMKESLVSEVNTNEEAKPFVKTKIINSK